jgi:hypothetical protein
MAQNTQPDPIDTYLESIGGLINGFYPDRPRIVSSSFFQCSSGWHPLIQELIQDLIELGWNKEACQIKEKFGGLRFYINEGSNEIYDRITEAEGKSYSICEHCGSPGEIRKDLRWIRTLCDTHYHEKKEEIKNRK